MQVDAALDVVDVEQQLRRVPDPGDGAWRGGRASARSRRPCRARRGTGRSPGRSWPGARRSPIPRRAPRGCRRHRNFTPLVLDDPVQVGAEGIEPGAGIDLDRRQAFEWREDRCMRGKPQIDAPPAVPERLPGEGYGEMDVVLQPVHLPDDTITLLRRENSGSNSWDSAPRTRD